MANKYREYVFDSQWNLIKINYLTKLPENVMKCNSKSGPVWATPPAEIYSKICLITSEITFGTDKK